MRTDRRTDLVLLLGVLSLALLALSPWSHVPQNPVVPQADTSNPPAPGPPVPPATSDRLDHLARQIQETNARLEEALTRLESAEVAPAAPNREPIVDAPAVRTGQRLASIQAKDGSLIASNVVFGGLYGRKLVFRLTDAPPLSVDVDDLAEATLQELGLNREDALQSRQRLDQLASLRQETQQQRFLQRQAAAERQMAAQAEFERDYTERLKEQNEVLARLAAENRANQSSQLLAAAILSHRPAPQPTVQYVYPSYHVIEPWYVTPWQWTGNRARSCYTGSQFTYQFNGGKHSASVAFGHGGTGRTWSGSSGHSVFFRKPGF